MSVIAQYRQGFSYGIDSIRIVYNNLVLLVYRAVPAAYQTIASFFVPTLHVSALWLSSSLMFQDMHGSPFSSFCLFMRTTTVSSFLLHAIFALTGTLLVVLSNCALCHHVMHVIHYRATTVHSLIDALTARKKAIAVWACLCLVIESALALLGIVMGTYIPYFSLILAIAWIYCSLLIIPIIMSNKKSLRTVFRLTYELTKRLWPEMLGGFSLFALLTITFWWILRAVASLVWSPLLLYGFLLVTIVIGTVRITFATLLYMRAYQEPNEELEALMHIDII